MSSKPKILSVVGPTASGKTELARHLATQFNGEIVSADSRQIYRDLDIGTGKEGELRVISTDLSPLAATYPELRFLGDVPQWLIDIVDPTERFTVAEYQEQAYVVIDDILRRGKLPIICGGTGLYINALVKGYVFDQNVPRDENNPRHSAGNHLEQQPPEWDLLTFGVEVDRDELYRRIDQRVDDRIASGMIQEGRKLIEQGIPIERLKQFGLEYKFLAGLYEKELSLEAFKQKLKYAIHGYARRQLTWFRKYGEIEWIKDYENAEKLAKRFLAS